MRLQPIYIKEGDCTYFLIFSSSSSESLTSSTILERVTETLARSIIFSIIYSSFISCPYDSIYDYLSLGKSNLLSSDTSNLATKRGLLFCFIVSGSKLDLNSFIKNDNLSDEPK